MANQQKRIGGERDAAAERIAAVLSERQRIATQRRLQERQMQEQQIQERHLRRCQPPVLPSGRELGESVVLE